MSRNRSIVFHVIAFGLIIAGLMIPMYLYPNNDDSALLAYGVASLYLGLWILPMIWVYSWTKEYNKYSI